MAAVDVLSLHRAPTSAAPVKQAATDQSARWMPYLPGILLAVAVMALPWLAQLLAGKWF